MRPQCVLVLWITVLNSLHFSNANKLEGGGHPPSVNLLQ